MNINRLLLRYEMCCKNVYLTLDCSH